MRVRAPRKTEFTVIFELRKVIPRLTCGVLLEGEGNGKKKRKKIARVYEIRKK